MQMVVRLRELSDKTARLFGGSRRSSRTVSPYGVRPTRYHRLDEKCQDRLCEGCVLSNSYSGASRSYALAIPCTQTKLPVYMAPTLFDQAQCRDSDYSCCGLHLNDLHAILEHFEQAHIVVLDPISAQLQIHENDPPLQPYYPHPYAQFDPDDMVLDLDLDNSPHAAHPLPPAPPPSSSRHSSARSSPSSCAPSPPDTPISTPLSAYPSPHNAFIANHHLPGFASPYISQPPSPPSTPYDVSSAPSTWQNSPTYVGHPPFMSKPFRCPKPNCNKSFRRANGLKYHMTHGSCNFVPPKDLEYVKDLLERRRREREQQAAQGAGLTRSVSLGSVPTPSGSSSSGCATPLSQNSTEDPSTPGTHLSSTSNLSLTYSDLSNISESDLREVEAEAERRLRPFACGVGECMRRYKNMNGLRYHYLHSGDHGSVGLALLASGQHECLGAGKRGVTTTTGYNSGMGVHRAAPTTPMGMKGSLSTPVSRAGSISLGASADVSLYPSSSKDNKFSADLKDSYPEKTPTVNPFSGPYYSE
jgi:hypothetical protein